MTIDPGEANRIIGHTGSLSSPKSAEHQALPQWEPNFPFRCHAPCSSTTGNVFTRGKIPVSVFSEPRGNKSYFSGQEQILINVINKIGRGLFFFNLRQKHLSLTCIQNCFFNNTHWRATHVCREEIVKILLLVGKVNITLINSFPV